MEDVSRRRFFCGQSYSIFRMRNRRNDYKWIVSYDNSRHKEPKMPNESWGNSRYGPLNMNWKDAQGVYLPSVKISVALAWNRLRKLWRSYNIHSSTGSSRTHTAYEINRYQVALDLPRTQFEELEGMVSDYEFENPDQDQDQDQEERPAEWSSFDEQLSREEQEAEADEYEQRKNDVFRDWD